MHGLIFIETVRGPLKDSLKFDEVQLYSYECIMFVAENGILKMNIKLCKRASHHALPFCIMFSIFPRYFSHFSSFLCFIIA